MKVLLVVESYFGNTMKAAEAIAAGIRDAGGEVLGADAMAALDTCDLLVVGAPTHNLGLPTPDSRIEAVKRGGEDIQAGIAEWLDSLPDTLRAAAAAFDTVTSKGDEAGSAAKQIAARLAAAGVNRVRQESFVVAGEPPELNYGELTRARDWGRQLIVD